jgi:hypothetical protein
MAPAAVDQRVDLLAVVPADRAGSGRHIDYYRLLVWVGPPVGAAGAGPGELPDRAHHPDDAARGAHGEPQAKAVVGAGTIGVADEVLDVGAELVRQHISHRARAEQPGLTEAAAVHQHRGEAQIIGCGRRRTAAAAFELEGLRQLGAARLRLAGVGICRQGLGIARSLLPVNDRIDLMSVSRSAVSRSAPRPLIFAGEPWHACVGCLRNTGSGRIIPSTRSDRGEHHASVVTPRFPCAFDIGRCNRPRRSRERRNGTERQIRSRHSRRRGA